jgi:hypothetical protein
MENNMSTEKRIAKIMKELGYNREKATKLVAKAQRNQIRADNLEPLKNNSRIACNLPSFAGRSHSFFGYRN